LDKIVMDMLGRILSSPAKVTKRLRQFEYFISHLPQHVAYLKKIRAARRRGVVGSDPLIGMKYLGVYLADSMSTAARRDAIAYHYGFLSRSITGAREARRWSTGADIWQLRDEETGQACTIRLESSVLSPMEGESQLRFIFGPKTLCTLTFSFINGTLLGLPAAAVLFIGGVQGGADCRREIRVAARMNGEIAAASMLLVAARAIAQNFGVGYVVGVSGDYHAANPHARQKISLSYDAMWVDSGAMRTTRGFFVIDPGTGKSLSDVSRTHRARTRRKRQRKLELRHAIAAEAERLFGNVASGMAGIGQDTDETPPIELRSRAPMSILRRLVSGLALHPVQRRLQSGNCINRVL